MSYDINLVHNNEHNMYTINGSAKDTLPLSLRSNIVYRIPCRDSHSTYIGQTKRHCKLEHENWISLAHVKSSNQFQFWKRRISVFWTVLYLKKRIISEMIHIKVDKNSVNHRTDKANFNLTYTSIIQYKD